MSDGLPFPHLPSNHYLTTPSCNHWPFQKLCLVPIWLQLYSKENKSPVISQSGIWVRNFIKSATGSEATLMLAKLMFATATNGRGYCTTGFRKNPLEVWTIETFIQNLLQVSSQILCANWSLPLSRCAVYFISLEHGPQDSLEQRKRACCSCGRDLNTKQWKTKRALCVNYHKIFKINQDLLNRVTLLLFSCIYFCLMEK